MPLLLVLALVIGVLACVFALQNTMPVAVTFMIWKYEASLALILLGTFAIGTLVGILTCFPTLIRAKLEARQARKNDAAARTTSDCVEPSRGARDEHTD